MQRIYLMHLSFARSRLVIVILFKAVVASLPFVFVSSKGLEVMLFFNHRMTFRETD